MVSLFEARLLGGLPDRVGHRDDGRGVGVVAGVGGVHGVSLSGCD